MDAPLRCPHCDHLIRDVTDWFDQMEEDVESECPYCEKAIMLSRTVTFHYKIGKA